MRNIEISEATFKRLRMVARNDETSELVIKRLLDENEISKPISVSAKIKPEAVQLSETGKGDLKKYEQQLQAQKAASWSPSLKDDDIQFFGAEKLPHSVTHTKVFQAKIENQPVPKSGLFWTPLICEVLKKIDQKGQFSPTDSFPDIAVFRGCKTDKGYKYIPEIDCSIQSVDANIALRCIARLARKHSISVNILIGWRNKPDSLFPGKFGKIEL